MFGLEVFSSDDVSRIRSDIRFAAVGGSLAAVGMAAVLVAVGLANSGGERFMVEAAMPSVRFLASAVMTVSATTLALMLTLLGLSTDIDGEIRKDHFERVRQIALVDVCAFVLATVLLVIVVVPVSEASPIPGRWYSWIYYGISVASSALGGGLVAVMLLLFAAIRDLIVVLAPGDENPLIDEETGESEGEAEEADGVEEEVEELAEATG